MALRFSALKSAENASISHRAWEGRAQEGPKSCDLEAVLASGRVPTNPTERPNGEIKRRAGVVGIFPSAAVIRLAGVILMEQNENGPSSEPTA